MIKIFKNIKLLLGTEELYKARIVLLLMLVMAFMEAIGVFSIMPFVAILANPEIVESNKYLGSAYEILNFHSIESFLMFLGLIVFVLYISALVLKAYSTYTLTKFSIMCQHSIACRLLSAYLHQPYEFFLMRNTADLSKRILAEVIQVSNGILLPILKIISGLIVAAALLSLLLLMSPVLSIGVCVLIGGIYISVYLITRNLVGRLGQGRLKANKKRYILAGEALNAVKELKVLGREKEYLERFTKFSEKFVNHQAKNKFVTLLPNYAIQGFVFGGILLLILFILAGHGNLKEILPYLALYTYAGYKILPAFQEIFGSTTQIRFNLPALAVLIEDIKNKENNVEDNYTSKIDKLGIIRDIQFSNISFCYEGANKPSLNNINITIESGSSIGVVGMTGAGKSTLLDLIMGLLTESSGEILIDGEKLDANNIRAWQNNIGYVPQSIFLSDDTILNNIAFGVSKENINEEAIIKAAKAAHIHDFINSELLNGYKTNIGERGIRLSGGQRQRLAIARALYHDPDVIVFDEATSALDNSTEKSVIDAIDQLHGLKTIIHVAHRLSTVSNCDKIIHLENGAVIGCGKYKELISESPAFRKLAQLDNSQAELKKVAI